MKHTKQTIFKMSNIRARALFVILPFFCMNCSNNPKDDFLPISTHPMQVGTKWTYNRQVIFVQYSSETPQTISDIDTIVSTDEVWIEKDTILNDSILVKAFKARFSNSLFEPTIFKYLDSRGLNIYGYTDSALTTSINSPYTKTLVMAMKHIAEFPKAYCKKGLVGGLFIENPPLLDIQYPLTSSSTWSYGNSVNCYGLINKSVVGAETLNLVGRNIACHKVKWNYTVPSSSKINHVDWISDIGLVKSIFVEKHTGLTGLGLVEPTYEIIVTITLTDYLE